jgi:hypothetical protein
MANQVMSQATLRRLIIALSGAKAGNEAASLIENGNAMAAQSGMSIPAAIVAAHVSTTTDFAALAVGDLLVHIPATAGNAAFETIVTAGTKPSAAVVGDLYVVLRAFSAPAAHNFKL